MISLNKPCAWFMALIVAQLVVIASCSSAKSETELASDDSSFKHIALFNYENYKSLYNKQYRTSLEDSTRRCFFYARAMAVFVSGVNYKYRVRDHFNALNEMSDWSPEERDRIKNRRIHPMVTRGMTKKLSESLAFLPAEGEQPEETLRRFLKSKKASNPKYQDLLNEFYQTEKPRKSSRIPRRSSRKKRAAIESPRNFSFERLVNFDTSPETYTKPVKVESNNPKHKFIDTMSRGLSDQIEEVKFIEYERQNLGSLESQLESKLGSLNIDDSKLVESDDNKEDAIFIDYRNSPCMSKIRSQGKCGSCYAFATITIIEWIYCEKKGLLVDFSEQYMIDCGNDHVEDMFGCEGATVEAVYEFVHNFGVELRSKYPYVHKNGTCPYDEGTNLESTGYIRMDLNAFMEVPIKYWPDALKREPLYLMIQLVEDFYEYGGGVYDGAQCLANWEEMDELHSVVLVGHGREDGKEYWLIRNSHGRNWGDKGYYKLSKSAPNCVYSEAAYALSWNGGQKVRVYRNRQHDDTILASKAPNKKATRRGRRRN